MLTMGTVSKSGPLMLVNLGSLGYKTTAVFDFTLNDTNGHSNDVQFKTKWRRKFSACLQSVMPLSSNQTETVRKT